MARSFPPVIPPTDPRQCAPWLNRELRKLGRQVKNLAAGQSAIQRNEQPDASGTPISVPPDLSGYFKLGGRANGQIGYGGVAAAEPLKFGSTSHATKGFIKLGTGTTAVVSVDETQALVGINVNAPLATLHIVGSLAGSASAMTLSGDVDPTGTQWVRRTGSGGGGQAGTLADSMNSDDGLTSYGSINTGSSGNNPQRCFLSGTITPGATYTITAKTTTLFVTPVYGGGNQNFWYITLVDSAGNEWQDNTLRSGTSMDATPITAFGTFVTITRTVTCSGTPINTGQTPNTIRLNAGAQVSHGGGGDLYTATSYVTIAQSGSAFLRWDAPGGTQSGGIDLYGRLGVGTGSTAIGAEVDVVGDTVSNPVLRLKAAASPTIEVVQVLKSTGEVKSGIDSNFSRFGDYRMVALDDNPVFFNDDMVWV